MKTIKLIIQSPILIPYIIIFIYTAIKKHKQDNPEASGAQFYLENLSSFLFGMAEEAIKYDHHFLFGGILFWSWIIYLFVK